MFKTFPKLIVSAIILNFFVISHANANEINFTQHSFGSPLPDLSTSNFTIEDNPNWLGSASESFGVNGFDVEGVNFGGNHMFGNGSSDIVFSLFPEQGYEDWMMDCGGGWECDWAWRDPEVMQQMLNGGHYEWSSTFEWGTGDISGECAQVSVGTNGARASCSFEVDAFSVVITGRDIAHATEPLRDALLNQARNLIFGMTSGETCYLDDDCANGLPFDEDLHEIDTFYIGR